MSEPLELTPIVVQEKKGPGFYEEDLKSLNLEPGGWVAIRYNNIEVKRKSRTLERLKSWPPKLVWLHYDDAIKLRIPDEQMSQDPTTTSDEVRVEVRRLVFPRTPGLYFAGLAGAFAVPAAIVTLLKALTPEGDPASLVLVWIGFVLAFSTAVAAFLSTLYQRQ